MSSLSETSGSNFSSDLDQALENYEVTLKNGNVLSTLKDDGFWQHKSLNKDHNLDKFWKHKLKHDKLTRESEKLHLKFDNLFHMSKMTLSEHDKLKEELQQLRHIWKKSGKRL